MKYIIALILFQITFAQYSWLETFNPKNSIRNQIPVDKSSVREVLESTSFGSWLRDLPTRPNQEKVFLYNGDTKWNQNAHYTILDVDVEKRNLQQCADATIRLRAEYLYSQKRFSEINFKFTSGDNCRFSDWVTGRRPKISGNKVSWVQTNKKGSDYNNFRSYLTTVFMYAGTYSLQRDLKKVTKPQIGDIFLQGGFPGHAVIIVDIAIDKITRRKKMLLAQSYMPAQDIHVLKNPNSDDSNAWYEFKKDESSPWYEFRKGDELVTPEWTFQWTDLYRF